MPRRNLGRRLCRIGLGAIAAVLLLLALVLLAGWLFLRASLPALDGSVTLPGLAAPASISRDANGSVTVSASNRNDLAYATGYAHAQDRFFQMDLLRRLPAGELAALVGADALPVDKRNRLHRFRARADQAYAALDAGQRAVLQRYADGVNAGLAAARARPFEYAVLEVGPQPWLPQDTLLVIDAMYLDLQGGELARVLSRGALRDRLPPDLLAFLTPDASRWDAPLDGRQPALALADIPESRPDWLGATPPASPAAQAAPDGAAVGSNAFAVAGTHGADGRARVANDMHLGLGLPNIWYRLTLVFPDPAPAGGQAAPRRVSGVGLPGAPVVVAGSNGDVAWGFTNSYGHFIDLVKLELDPADPRRYRGPSGEWETVDEHVETIVVKGQADEHLPVRETRWGPMLQAGGQTYAVRWTAHQPGATDLGLMGLETARDVPQALRVAQTAGVPTQNFVVADREGHVGWTLAGLLPAAALDPQGFPVPAARAGASFVRLPADAYPQIVDPPQGRLWTANNTQLGDAAAQRRIGDGGADFGARATQIRDGLAAAGDLDERKLLAIQLDDRALWLAYWRTLALDTLDAAALDGHPGRAAFKRIVAGWNGRADADAAGYTLMRDFYLGLYEAWFGPLDTQLAAAAPDFAPHLSVGRASSRLEPVMETLARRGAWVPAPYADSRAFMLARIDAAIAANTVNGASLDDARWGDRNRLAVGHAFARLLPAPLRGWLSAPAERMPGDMYMPRIQRPSFGASERFVVAPGHEETGIMEMPGGASGHPLSPFFLAGHEAWAHGEPAPFLPGPEVHRLVMTPAR